MHRIPYHRKNYSWTYIIHHHIIAYGEAQKLRRCSLLALYRQPLMNPRIELFFDNHLNSSNLKQRESAANSNQISSNGPFKDGGANENRVREKIAQIQIAREED